MKRRLVLLGPPASGKGTQAEMILAKYQIPTASPGAILREQSKAGTALGLEAADLTKQGRLVPDSVVNRLVEHWLIGHAEAFVFDGYPRSFGQAEALDKMLAENHSALDVVVSLDVDFATSRDRVSRRMMCSSCGRIASRGLQAMAPERCAACGGVLVKRADDTEEVLIQRLAEYEEKSRPLESFYEKRGLLRKIDATRAPDVVFWDIAQLLEA